MNYFQAHEILEEDRKRAVPPSLEVLARMAELCKGVA
jgi:hypothetical protein